MGIFKKKPVISEFTENTAPKEKKVTLQIEGKIFIPQDYGSANIISKLNIEKQMLSSSDTNKEIIKEEIAKELENIYNEICIQIDNNSTELTNEFWYNLNLQKQEENESKN